MFKVKVLAILGIAVASAAHAGDSYNPSSGQLTIPSIQVGSTTYSDVVVTVTVDKINSVGGAAAAPSNPLLGSWALACNASSPAPVGPCSPAVGYVINLNADGTFSRSLTYQDGSAISTETGTFTGGNGSIHWTVSGCTMYGSPAHNVCDAAGTIRNLTYTVVGSGIGSIMTLNGLSTTQVITKITP